MRAFDLTQEGERLPIVLDRPEQHGMQRRRLRPPSLLTARGSWYVGNALPASESPSRKTEKSDPLGIGFRRSGSPVADHAPDDHVPRSDRAFRDVVARSYRLLYIRIIPAGNLPVNSKSNPSVS
jgi:hypothetical protein